VAAADAGAADETGAAVAEGAAAGVEAGVPAEPRPQQEGDGPA
jgi:hypothetical protein